jgi:hypothetical protein
VPALVDVLVIAAGHREDALVVTIRVGDRVRVRVRVRVGVRVRIRIGVRGRVRVRRHQCVTLGGAWDVESESDYTHDTYDTYYPYYTHYTYDPYDPYLYLLATLTLLTILTLLSQLTFTFIRKMSVPFSCSGLGLG